MKKLFVILISMLLSAATITASGANWTKTFIVTSGEEPTLNLTKGDRVRVTEYDYTSSSNSYYIEIPAKMSEANLTESAGGMWGMTFKTFKYFGRNIEVRKNNQASPSWMRIGGCELREQR